MTAIERPSNWEKMDYGEKLMWILEKQQELKKGVEEAFANKAA
ncbi:MAG: hypothetical protein V3V92_03560 [Candidatus Hydrothermarchaeales archaeon]